MARVSSLHIYPVKSCRGHSVSSAELDDWGFVGDRRYLIVTPDGRFVTQRQLAELALIETELRDGALTLSSPNFREVTVRHPAAKMTVQIWKDTVVADDCGAEAAEWLTRRLGQPMRLVHMGADYVRPVKPSKAKPGDVVTFADAYPMMLMTEATVADLNDRIQENGGEPVPMNRFRPNIVVADTAPLAEDGWTSLQIGAVRFRSAGLCARCIIPTIDQVTAERGKEPVRTLAEYRRDPVDTTNINFGINLVHETKRGRVDVGAEVVV